MAKHEFHVYASTKTTAQLLLDLAAAISHIFTLFVFLRIQNRDTLWDVFFYLLIATIVIQVILAIGLFSLRLVTLNHGSTRIPHYVKIWNNIFFWACLLVALLEIIISGYEKFALEGAHGNGTECLPNFVH